jgi:general secretion pathway protein D
VSLCLCGFLFLGSILSDLAFAQETESKEQLISMSFREAELDYVLDFFSRATGYTIVKDADIKARVTIISQKDISVDQAFSVLNSILAIKGYATIVNDRIVKVVPLEDAKRENMEIRVGSDPAEIAPTETIVTQIMPLSSANAAQIAKDLKDLIPEYGVMVAHTQSNTLIITAASSNIKRFAQIVRELDVPMSDMIKVEVFIIKYREAETLAKVLEDVFEKPQGTSAAQQAEQERAARLQRFRGRGPGGAFGPPGEETSTESPTSTESEALQIRSNVKVVADADTNSLIVSASQENIDLIRELIEKLDVELTDQAETRIFALEHADATEVADELNQVFESSTANQTFGQMGFGFRRSFLPGQPSQQDQGTQVTKEGGILGLPEINVVADEHTNSVIVTTTSQQMENISRLITQLDRDVAEYEQDTKVFSLENAEAANLARVLNELLQTTMFEQQRGRTTTASRGGVMGTAAETIETARGLTGNVKIVAEETTNSLIITTYFRNFEKLEKIIKELDVMLPQVLIEVKIVEVTLDDDSKFGVEWMWEHTTSVGDKNYVQNGTTAFGLADEIYGLKYGILGEALETLLMALEKNTKVNILSTPRIMTLDNREAIINIGQEVPYLESTQETATGGVLTSYDFRDVGVILTVTPRINKSETVTLDVNQQINSLIEFTLFNAPVIAKREATASVTVKDGQTMIIGGIIEDNKTETIHKVPIIGSVPFIGKLFQREETKMEKTELMVFITPHIIHNPEEADEITQNQRSGLTFPNRAAK